MPLHLNISASQLTGDYYERKEKKSNILITQPEVTTKKAGGVRVLCASFFFLAHMLISCERILSIVR